MTTIELRNQKRTRRIAIVLTVLVHLAIIGVMVYGAGESVDAIRDLLPTAHPSAPRA